MRFFRIPGLLLAALCTLALPQARSAAQAPAADAQAEVHARPALWIVQDKDTTIYLFGTIHLLKPGIRWFEGPVKSAFDRADEVVLEIADTPDAATQARIVQRAMDPDGPPLSEKLPDAVRPKFAELLREARLPAAAVNRMKPWFAAVTLTSAPLMKLGYDPAQGVEARLRAMASAQGKTLTGLETTEEQLGFFESLSEPLQMSLLVETINEVSTIDEIIGQMIAAWTAGDPAALADTLNAQMSEDEELEKLLLLDRNERWADWIKARLKRPGTVFLAVGAGHLAGKGSVQEALRARKVKAKRVKPDKS